MREQAATIVEQGEKLEQMAALIAENQQLRGELDAICKWNAELEALLHQEVVTPMAAAAPTPATIDSMAVDDRRDTWGSKHAPTEDAYAAEAPLRAQQKAAAEKLQQQRQARLAKKMDKAFDRLEQQKHSGPSTLPQPTMPTAPLTTANAAPLKPVTYAAMTGRNVRRNGTKSSTQAGPPSARLVTWAQRLLQPGNDQTGYTIVYMPSPRRTTHSEIRRALSVLGAATERVLDVHFPVHGVVGLLIHQSYEQELVALLKQNKLTPRSGFNPTAASTIGDPALLAKLTESQRATEAKKLYNDRMLSMCLRMPKVHLGVAIMRHFHELPSTDHHHIDDAHMAQFQTARPKPKRKRGIVQAEEDARRLLGGEVSQQGTNDQDDAMHDE